MALGGSFSFYISTLITNAVSVHITLQEMIRKGEASKRGQIKNEKNTKKEEKGQKRPEKKEKKNKPRKKPSQHTNYQVAYSSSLATMELTVFFFGTTKSDQLCPALIGKARNINNRMECR